MTSWIEDDCETNGIRVHYLRTGGDKPPVVLLHGLMGSGACWTPLARALEHDFDVIMPDARGHGRSSAPTEGYAYDDLANDVVGLTEALGLDRPAIVGHSMGGMTAAVVASRGVELRGVVLVDPTFLSPARQREVFASPVFEEHRRALRTSPSELVAQARARHPQRSQEIIELQATARLETSVSALDVLRPPNPDYRALVCAIDAPALLVIGDSPVVTLDMAKELCALQEALTLEQIDNAGHGLPFEQPQRLAHAVSRFLRELA
jgi:pimeloyl-ACP methyl ester carboxylesterase